MKNIKIVSFVLVLAVGMLSAEAAKASTGKTKMRESGFNDYWKNQKSNSIEKFLSEDFYRKIARGEVNRVFYPPFSDRKAWNNIARSKFKANMKKEVIAQADAIMNQTFEALSTYDYFRFVLEGNRARFEQAYFRRRNNLGTLVMAMCLTGDRDKYFPSVIDHLGAIVNEAYWCGHAHAPHDSDPMPNANVTQKVDLFCSETGVTVALTLQILRDEIISLSPRFYKYCKNETLKRTVLPVMDNFEIGTYCEWTHAKGNWASWCAFNILFTAAVLLDDPLQLAEITRKMNKTTAGFFDTSDADGYCNEGPGYWYQAAVKMFNYSRTLNTMVPGSAKLIFKNQKFRWMGDFGALMVINGRDHVVSADCGHVTDDGIFAAISYDFGKAIESDQLRTFALNRLQPDSRRRPVTPAEAAFCRFGSGARLAGLLDFFFKLPADPAKEPRAKLPAVSFWPGRMGIIRNADGFSAALKGGHNAEAHNHNDLGHFTFYYGARPLVIDLGTGMYSRKNFSPDRYQLYYTNGAGHNAFCFGKNIQQAGREFEAGLVMPDPKTLTADLSKAYPVEAGVKKYIRTLNCTKKQVVISDRVELKKKSSTVSTLYSIADVKKCADATLDFGGGIRCTLKGAECVSITPVALEDIPRHWGSKLWRITIKTTKPESAFVFTKQ